MNFFSNKEKQDKKAKEDAEGNAAKKEENSEEKEEEIVAEPEEVKKEPTEEANGKNIEL